MIVTVREYARLTTEGCKPSLDVAQVPASAFRWLCDLQSRWSKSGAKLLELEGQTWLRLNSLVGVMQTPCGITLEILPKTHSDEANVQESRGLLRKMILALLDLPAKEAQEALLDSYPAPLTEWVMVQFVKRLNQLFHQGIRSDYVRVEEEQPFLRGQLNTTSQLRQLPSRAHLFHIRHDVFSPDQPANRLLRLALERVRKNTIQPETWRLATELTQRLAEVPVSTNKAQDWRAWGDDRLMARYRTISPWCALVLGEEMPVALMGQTKGISFLFPMEKLFENYVSFWLKKHISVDYEFRTQARSHYLAYQDGKKIFQLKPDLVLQHKRESTIWVLDTKWKRLDGENRENNYGISQDDMYQMLAYGTTYLQGEGRLILIYPKWERFQKAINNFQLPGGLRLDAMPFDLKGNFLITNDRLDFL